MKKRDEVVDSLREHLGIIRSCALMMAHAQSASARSKYLRSVTQELRQIEALLTQFEQAPGSRRAAAE
jgi:hypothetical protein